MAEWEYEKNFKNEANRDHWNLICPKCGDIWPCENETDVEWHKIIYRYCPNCGMNLRGKTE